MIYTVAGCFAFVLLFIFDINKMISKFKYNYIFNYSGILILFFASVLLIMDKKGFRALTSLHYIYLAMSIIFFFLLFYSLFIELPFKSTYIQSECNRKVIDTGTYALCRHPGVIWFALAYLFLALFVGTTKAYISAAVWSSLNIIYVILQEKLIFIKTFDDYNEYMISTPMLIPNMKSAQKCIKTLFVK